MTPYKPTQRRRAASWEDLAACKGMDTDLFFPSESGWTGVVGAERAKTVCRTCPVRPECLDMAMTDRDLRGVWGGTTWRERQDARKAARRAGRRNAKKKTATTAVKKAEQNAAKNTRTRRAAALIAAQSEPKSAPPTREGRS